MTASSVGTHGALLRAEIAQAILFLASDDCPCLTGASLVADGGLLSGL